MTLGKRRGLSLTTMALATTVALAGLRGSAQQTSAAPAPLKEARSFKFSFGARPVEGYTHIDAAARYTPAAPTPGFENIGGAFPKAVAVDSADPLHSGYLTADAPFFFSVNVPEGNYKVTVTLGGNEAAETTVKAELRRLMLENVKTEPGQFVTKTFAVNVHKPAILDETGKQMSIVRLSGREVGGPGGGGAPAGGGPALNRTQGGEGWSWDDSLTLEFSGKPAVAAIDIERDDTIRNIFIAGDSTVCDQPAEPFTSWGQMITRWIKTDYAVSNYAISGNTAAAFIAANRLAKIVSLLHPGDYVFVQYGHNDMKNNAAGALDIYKNSYRKFAADTRAKGATIVLMTPVSRETFENGKITNSFINNMTGEDYLKGARDVAAELNSDFIDLNAISATVYEAIGPGKAQAMFANASEKTHHSDYGGYLIARSVVQAIVDRKLPLAKSISEDWKTFDPARPAAFADFKLPLDPMPGGRGGATPAGN